MRSMLGGSLFALVKLRENKLLYLFFFQNENNFVVSHVLL